MTSNKSFDFGADPDHDQDPGSFHGIFTGLDQQGQGQGLDVQRQGQGLKFGP